MKTVKVKHVGFWSGVSYDKELISRSLKGHYNIEESDEPEFVICSIFGKPFEYCDHPQVRIMYAGENFIPDFNLVDYAVGVYPLSFGDRYCYLPGCIDGNNHCAELQHKSREYPDSVLEQKPYFANFIASHDSENNIRGDFFKKLSEYKRVESPGSFLNNMSDGMTVSLDEGKTEFQQKCKFTLCFESTNHYGFITEKITDAFYADTIPVYFGSSSVSTIFNPKAFINCSDYDSFDEVIKRIIELDQDDEAYMEMLRQPVFIEPDYVDRKMQELDSFLLSIIEQGAEKAYRRSKVYAAYEYEKYIKDHRETIADIPSSTLLKTVYNRVRHRISKH